MGGRYHQDGIARGILTVFFLPRKVKFPAEEILFSSAEKNPTILRAKTRKLVGSHETVIY